MEERINSRLNKIEQQMDRLDHLQTRMEHIEERLENVETCCNDCINSSRVESLSRDWGIYGIMIEKINNRFLSSLSFRQRTEEVKRFLDTHTFDDNESFKMAHEGLRMLNDVVDEKDEDQQTVKDRWTRYQQSVSSSSDEEYKKLSDRDKKIGYALDKLLEAGMYRLFGFYPVSFPFTAN